MVVAIKTHIGDNLSDKGPAAVLSQQVHHGDCIAGMNGMPAGSVDMVFADPPFNIGYKYDQYKDNLTTDDYLAFSKQWMAGVHRVLKPDGTFWLAIGNKYAAHLVMEALKVGFHQQSWVVWHFTFGTNNKAGFTPSHTHLIHFVKDPKRFTFRVDDLENRIPSARQLIYDDIRSNPTGRLPDSVWIFRPQDAPDMFLPEHDTWHVARVAGTFKERAGFHGCQMPEQVLARMIRFSSHEGELILDPFSGSASTLVTAKKLGRRFMGFDISADYVRLGNERLDQTKVGDPLAGKPEVTMKNPPPKGRRSKKVVADAVAVPALS